MNKMLIPKIIFRNVIADEKRIKTAYARLFNIARGNILSKKRLTKGLSQEYTEIQYGKRIFDDRRSSQKITSQQADGLPIGHKRTDTGL